MIKNNETLVAPVESHDMSTCPSYTETILMIAAAALVGFLMVYLVFFDGVVFS